MSAEGHNTDILSGKVPAAVLARPTLHAWLDEYAAIESDYIDAIASRGILFEDRDEARLKAHDLRAQLRDRGARFLNNGSSVSTGFLSSACAACVGNCSSRTFYINLRCNRNCYFCFNPNQADFEEHCAHDTPWRSDLKAYIDEVGSASNIGLTGGEPLLYKDEMIAFFRLAHELSPDAHLRLYTSGFGLDEETCHALVDAGLTEIRFSVKLEDGEEAVDEALRSIEIASGIIPDVMVEMPVVPGTLERMEKLLCQLDERGVVGINLLEMCFPLRNWPEFEQRGMRIKNPPFEVLYNYGYAGGLPVAGSEEECLELVLYAMDMGLNMGVHYCSLHNKNIDQILQCNRAAGLNPALYKIDDDGFIKCAKVFDSDVVPVQHAFTERGIPYILDPDEEALSFHPDHIAFAKSMGVFPVLSYNVAEPDDDGWAIRELALKLTMRG